MPTPPASCPWTNVATTCTGVPGVPCNMGVAAPATCLRQQLPSCCMLGNAPVAHVLSDWLGAGVSWTMWHNYCGLVDGTVTCICGPHHMYSAIKRVVGGSTRAADFLSIVEGYNDGRMTERNSRNLRFHHDCQRPTTGVRGLAPHLCPTLQRKGCKPFIHCTNIWCPGLSLEITYQHGMEPHSQALSGRESKQGLGNYVALERKPLQQGWPGLLARWPLGLHSQSTVLGPMLAQPKSSPSWLPGQTLTVLCGGPAAGAYTC